jgi:hypothetical protein
MNKISSRLAWTEANRLFLTCEFARLKERLVGNGEGGERQTAPPIDMEAPPAIDRLSEIFGLSSFERDVLLLAAAIEMESELAAASGNSVTFGLALAKLADPHWDALTPKGRLRRFRLVELERGHTLTSAPLRIDERILHCLVGINQLDPRLEPWLQRSPFPDWIAEEHKAIATEAVRAGTDGPLLLFCGDDEQGQEDVAAFAASRIGLQLFKVRADDLLPVGPDLDQIALLFERESLLLPAALLIRCGQTGLSTSARRLAERLPGIVMLASPETVHVNRTFLRFDVNKPAPAEQRLLWQNALGPMAASLNGTLDRVSDQFRLSARTIHSTGALVDPHNGAIDPTELWNVCRSLARPRLEHLAQRLTPSAGWDDLVLPDLQMQTLRHLFAQVQHRRRVYETWGFSAKGRRGLGVTALFAGESGTGKTLAAEVLAHELAMDLYRIDLSAVVSKYIGETEKNLKQVFDAAEEGGSLLLFDEADALFGRRTEVNDGNSHYANIEVGYLLQRMEAYQGLAILTTNRKSSIDQAFQRRLRFTIDFRFPDAAQRQAIWKVAFPPGAPVQDLDTAKLAQLKVNPGNIRNMALNAAFLAAAAGTPVGMGHLLEAAGLEAQKMERPLSEAEVRGWV